MARHTNANFSPSVPSRTFSDSSTLTGHSASSASQPTSPASPGARSPCSPTEQSFFDAITSRVRSSRSRSRSRSRNNTSRRPRSPLPTPPSTTTDSQTTLTNSMMVAGPASPMMGQMVAQVRTPTHASSRSQDSTNMWYGRHSNSWLFNDFSVTNSVKGVLRRH